MRLCGQKAFRFAMGTLPALVLAEQALAQAPFRSADYINPLVGTAPITDPEYVGKNPAPGEELYYGDVSPGASVPDPVGFLYVSPVSGFDGCCAHVRGSGYRYDDATLMGFTHHNTNTSDLNSLLFMPTTGALKIIPGSRSNPTQGYRSYKDTLQEKAAAGYYSVFLSTYGIKVELTATANCGFHRYTYTLNSQPSHVLIDLGNARPKPSDASTQIIGKRTMEGYQKLGNTTYYFHAEFNKDFSGSGTWKSGSVQAGSASASGTPIGAYADFATAAGEAVLVKVGISTAGPAQAASNLTQEIPGWDFDAVRNQAEGQWNTLLNRIVIEGGAKSDLVNFYTSAYRLGVGPSYGLVPGFGSYVDGLIFVRGRDWMNKRRQDRYDGWGRGYWGPGVGGILAMYNRNFRNFDANAAYQSVRNQAMTGGTGGAAYRQYGYIPPGSGVADYVNRSLGYAFDDYVVAQFAKIVGNTGDYDLFLARSKNYAKLYDKSVGFFRGKNGDGTWVSPFDPVEPHAEDVYREGNAWGYLWFVMQDLPGLIKLMGDTTTFISRLDAFFSTKYNPRVPLRDLTGLIGLYFHGNEQYRQIPFYYNYVGQPWKTQALVRKIMKALHRPVPAGLCGMDDRGLLTGWYVVSALGLGIMDFSTGYLEIGSPLFPKVTLNLDGAAPGTFVIEAHNVSDANMYVQSAMLNGKPLNIPRFHNSEIKSGGSLVLEMGPAPNKDWGNGKPVTGIRASGWLGPQSNPLVWRSGSIEVALPLDGAAVVGLRITDVHGRTVRYLEHAARQGGSCVFSVPVGGLSEGAYLVEGTANGKTFAKKAFVQVR